MPTARLFNSLQDSSYMYMGTVHIYIYTRRSSHSHVADFRHSAIKRYMLSVADGALLSAYRYIYIYCFVEKLLLKDYIGKVACCCCCCIYRCILYRRLEKKKHTQPAATGIWNYI